VLFRPVAALHLAVVSALGWALSAGPAATGRDQRLRVPRVLTASPFKDSWRSLPWKE
jgi:hypothetical protein